MVSDKFMVNSDAQRMAAAQYATEDFAGQARLSKRDTLRLGLLVEETLGMVKTMVDDFYGQLWFVSDESGACEIHLQATADMNAGKRNELLTVSSTGKNAAPRGFMRMLGDMLTGTLSSIGRTMGEYSAEVSKYGVVPQGINTPGTYDITPIWTLRQYKSDLNENRDDGDLEGAFEDLQKSIVANLADDVIVGVKGDRIELVISKKF
ncbi:MAG: hypothetical protein IJ124_00070 [Clostridia bacterium]|nr:hypothetical protein [Clostridia bacterium]